MCTVDIPTVETRLGLGAPRLGLGAPLVGLSLVWSIAWRLFIAKAMSKQILLHQEHFTDLANPMPQLGITKRR